MAEIIVFNLSFNLDIYGTTAKYMNVVNALVAQSQMRVIFCGVYAGLSKYFAAYFT